MKKFLWFTNIITLVVLIYISAHYKVPQKAFNRVFHKTTMHKDSFHTECLYDLKNFDFHHTLECDTPSILMLGNSIISHGDWPTLLNRKDIINRGISGDNLSCMCQRLKYLHDAHAKIWFIEGGTNDLPRRKVADMFANYKTIVEYVKAEHSIPVINLIIYISPIVGIKFPTRADYKKINGQIKELNTQLILYAKANHIDYIDLNKVVADENDILKDEYTIDGVHLNEKGYKEWSALINKILVKNNI